MKRCTSCVLPETFPGIRFDADGVCQYCRRIPDAATMDVQKARLRQRLDGLVEELRDRPGYQCLVSWSGGKDSTYTLHLMKQAYGLRSLAFTFDNGFVSPGALRNMRVVAENLGVDHITVKPRFDVLKQLFIASTRAGMYPLRALERASGICNTCMGIAKGIALRLALEEQVPMLVYGWSPGQIPLTSAIFHSNRRMLQAMIGAAKAPLEDVVDGQVDVFFPENRHWERVQDVPYNVSPLAFLEYDETTVLRAIRPLGWERPDDTDPNSTNCLLNGFANRVHIEQLGYHPYAMELAGLVRERCMTREEALLRLQDEGAPEVVAAVEEKLGILGTGHRKEA